MKKMLQVIVALVVVLVVFFTASLKNNLSLLTLNMKPEKWVKLYSHIVLETNIVFSLGVILSFAGLSLLKDEIKARKSGIENYSKLFWELGLILWSLSIFLAGVSYQIFSYVLKCSGRDTCLWATWWEIAYLFTFVLSMNLILIAVSYSSFSKEKRKLIIAYSIVNDLFNITLHWNTSSKQVTLFF